MKKTFLCSSKSLKEQASNPGFWSETIFINSHSSFERSLWPQFFDFDHPDMALKFGRADREQEWREEVPIDRYHQMHQIILDNVGIHKITLLTKMAWNVTRIVKNPSWIGRRSDEFIFRPRTQEGVDHDSEMRRRGLRETNLSGVVKLRIILHNAVSPWSRNEGNIVNILPLAHPDVQLQLVCLLRCMPSLKNVVVRRDVTDDFLRTNFVVNYPVDRTQLTQRVSGAVLLEHLQKTDRKVESWLLGKIGRPSSILELASRKLWVYPKKACSRAFLLGRTRMARVGCIDSS